MTNKGNAIDYARVLYQVCEEEKIIDEVLYETKSLLLIHDQEIIKVLSIPIISKTQKKELLDSLTDAGIRKEIINLTKILVDNNDFNLFNEIIYNFQDIYQEKNDILIVNISSAQPLDGDQIDSIRHKIEEKLSKFVVIIPFVDPSLIGGIKIEYDSKLIDNTVLKYLEALKNIDVK